MKHIKRLIRQLKTKAKLFRLKRRVRRNMLHVAKVLKKNKVLRVTPGTNGHDRVEHLRALTRREGETDQEFRQRIQETITTEGGSMFGK